MKEQCRRMNILFFNNNSFMNIDLSRLKLVSRGSNSGVYRYGTQLNAVAIKMVPSSCKKETKHLANEYMMLSEINHENIIKVLRYKKELVVKGVSGSDESSNSKDILVLENASEGNLLEWFQKARPTIRQIRWVMSELFEGVRYLHRNYIVHRDLKLENVLVNAGQYQLQIKIADFGFAARINPDHLSREYKGTRRAFMAPEIHALLQDPNKAYDPFKADIFALGVILFSMLLGKLPFQYGILNNPHYKQIAQGNKEAFWKLHSAVVQKISAEEDIQIEDFKQLFFSMVHYDPTQRPSIQKVLENEWLKGHQQIITVN